MAVDVPGGWPRRIAHLRRSGATASDPAEPFRVLGTLAASSWTPSACPGIAPCRSRPLPVAVACSR
jgi:hypothetical protein